MCIKEIKDNDEKCTTRKIKECEKIKEEDKRDGLAIATTGNGTGGWQRLKEEMTALEEEKDITPMNEEGGKEENVTGVVSDGVRG